MRRQARLIPKVVGCLITLSSLQAHAQATQSTSDPAVPPGLFVVATLHAEGAQIYECRAGADGRPAWQFREPIATLMEGGRTVGQHYAGPSWRIGDGGGVIVGRLVGQLPGAGAGAIPWLRLEVTEGQGTDAGPFAGVTQILRINTSGGVADGTCPTRGALRSIAYAADYLFLTPQQAN